MVDYAKRGKSWLIIDDSLNIPIIHQLSIKHPLCVYIYMYMGMCVCIFNCLSVRFPKMGTSKSSKLDRAMY